jgi:hypothetical protein
MRITHADVAVAARALMGLDPDARTGAALGLIASARLGLRHRQVTGRAHPVHGAGSLMEVVRMHRLPPGPGFDDRDYRACFMLVLRALDAH